VTTRAAREKDKTEWPSHIARTCTHGFDLSSLAPWRASLARVLKCAVARSSILPLLRVRSHGDT
jgi:hypothetical protein